MNKIYIFAIIFVLGLIIFGVWRSPDDKGKEQKKTLVVEETAVLESQTNSEGGVTVMVTPKNLSVVSWNFEVSLSTHSVELDEDLIKVAVLVDENGKEFKPISWEGSPAGGHHREGILKFNALTPKPESIKLIIREVGGIKERVFVWPIPNN